MPRLTQMPDKPSLREFQQWMKARILPGCAAASSLSPLKAQRQTPGEARLAVYAGGYLERMREALAEVFEATQHVLGESVFADLSESYARKHPSHETNLSLAGRYLPQFLQAWPRTQELPFLPDLARLEWLVCVAFHAFDQPPMNPTPLAALTPETYEHLRFSFQPSVGTLQSPWPVLDIWQARKEPPESIAIALADRPQQVLVYRQQTRVLCAAIEVAQYALLAGLMEGKTLGELCSRLIAESPDDDVPISRWFAHWAQQGLFTGCGVDFSGP